MTEINTTTQIDYLNRREEIENLTPLLQNLPSPFVMSIDAEWGSGKTTFVKLWQDYLSEKGIYSIYIDAWKTDHTDDPLIAMLGTLQQWLELEAGKQEEGSKPNFKKIVQDKKINDIARAIPNILKKSISKGIKLATLDFVDLENEDLLADFVSEQSENAIKLFIDQSKEIESFKEKLEKIIIELKSSDQKNFIVFIDELDRCRPTYSIELLERIKHLFNIEGISFVISTDLEQLGYSASSLYGEKFNGRKYLERFIDMTYKLKTPSTEEIIQEAVSKNVFMKKAICTEGSQSNSLILYNDEKTLVSCVSTLADYHNMPPRDIEKFIKIISYSMATFKPDEHIHIPLLVILTFIKNYRSDIFEIIYIEEEKVLNDIFGCSEFQCHEFYQEQYGSTMMYHEYAIVMTVYLIFWRELTSQSMDGDFIENFDRSIKRIFNESFIGFEDISDGVINYGEYIECSSISDPLEFISNFINDTQGFEEIIDHIDFTKRFIM